MYGKSKMINVPSDIHAKEKLNLYVYEYLYHIGAIRAAQGFCADMKWEPNKLSLGEAPGFLLNWWCVFWDLYSAAPERREQHPHSEEAKAFYDYGFMNSNSMPPQPNPNMPPSMPMNMNESMRHTNAPFFPGPAPAMMHPYSRYSNPPPPPPPRSINRIPSQADYPIPQGGGGTGLPSPMDPSGMRTASPGARMTTAPMIHSGPPGPPLNPYRPQGMSPSMNQTGPRLYGTNSPGVGFCPSSPVPYGNPGPPGPTPNTPNMMSNAQDSNSGEIQPYNIRPIQIGIPGIGPNSMYNDPSVSHMPTDASCHGSMNGEYEQTVKQSPNQSSVPVPPPDPNNFTYSEDPSNATDAILRIKQSMQEEVQRFNRTSTDSSNDEFTHFGSIG